MAHIFITRKILDDGLVLLEEAGHDVTVSEKDGALTREELLDALSKKLYEAVVTMLSDTVDGALMDAAPSVKIFANYAVGYDNLHIEDANARGVTLTNTPGVLTDAVAEHTFALVMALAKRIPEADRFTRAGLFDGWGPLLFIGTELNGKALGLIGAGRIGTRVAEIARAFGMHVVYYDIERNETIEKLGVVYRSSVDEVVAEADFVSLHVPLLDSTRHLINAERLEKMNPQTYLINTSRGPVIDEHALVTALRAGTIRGAALDVFEAEPALTPGLSELENVVLTPHSASATHEARSAMSIMVAENIIAQLNGERAPNALTA